MSKPKIRYKAVKRYGGTDFFSEDTVILLTPKERHYGDENVYFVLPATPEAYDAQVEAMAKTVRGQIDCGDDEMVLSTDACIFALAAIGIIRHQPRDLAARTKGKS